MTVLRMPAVVDQLLLALSQLPAERYRSVSATWENDAGLMLTATVSSTPSEDGEAASASAVMTVENNDA